MPTNDPRTDRELVMAHRETGDDSAREALILRYSGLARAIARRFARRGMAHDDVLQSGYVGLIQAVDRYDPARGVPLRAYAARTIEGEIMHLFRDRGWAVRVPRPLQELSRSLAVVRSSSAIGWAASPPSTSWPRPQDARATRSRRRWRSSVPTSPNPCPNRAATTATTMPGRWRR